MKMNNWLENEEKSIESCIKHNLKDKRMSNMLFRRAMFLLAFPGLLAIHTFATSAVYIDCPHCEEEINVDCERARWFPDTWICGSCGYDNYDGINTCAVCGTSR